MDNIQSNAQIDHILSSPPVNTYIPTERLLALRSKGLTYRDIGKLVNMPHNTIIYRLRAAGWDEEENKAFKDNRSEIFAGFQKELLFSIDREEIKKIPPASRITAAAILYDKERLERDLATQITKYDGLPDTQIAAIVCNNLNSLGGLDKLLDKIPVDKRDQVRGLLSDK
jgi:hypothetical protein